MRSRGSTSRRWRSIPHGVYFTLPEIPPDVDPTEQWIAYGVVFDDDRDGVPDRRVGKDNKPETVAGGTTIGFGSPTSTPVERRCQEGPDYVGEVYGSASFHGRFSFGFDTTNGGRHQGHEPGEPAPVRMGFGDPGWSGRCHGLCPRCRVA